ncbi:Alanine--tRNA ligase [Planctomycetes bacterium Poly30]|uniref:Alanine--tRNA ligase n=1 Tax=Saltatorellus ferox TaxID=2528018 RepID=A0A518ET99_9BACT|nr:Alanine--tRNA ligase [Planctomycetes bacterium Poly30]
MTPGDVQTFTATRVRKDFLHFFEERGHRIVPSAPVFPQDDPTLLFTNAGMNQFKDVFLGTGTRPYKRAVDTQKCIRVQGKHNDLEEVGRDTYHHTFFEMLGNWSFGDYFKEDAIVWSWTLLTEVWGMPKDRLWVTVFAGDEKDGLPADTEAEEIWKTKTDIDPSHVLRFDKSDNFWEMGETGPCGPCTEIHIDRGGPDSDPNDGADIKIGVNAGNERFIELWNNVFMQFNRQDDGSLVELPAKSVDTGMGFERVLAVLQGKSSNYDTDLFQPIFRAIERVTGKTYHATPDDEADVAFRVCADHVRAFTSAVADGVTPSNEGRGYVLRRLVRRASRYGLQHLGAKEPFLFEVVAAVVDVLGEAFPEMKTRKEHVQLVMKTEEESFRKTLDRGLVQFEKLAQATKGMEIDGKDAYELYATYGFPQDLVELMARERGMSVDTAGWDAAREAHSEVSKSEGSFKQILSAEELSGLPGTVAVYHEDEGGRTECNAEVVRYFPALSDRPARLILDRTSFYADAGGQVGDTGLIEAQDGTFRFVVEETKKMGDVHVHIGQVDGEPVAGAGAVCLVDAARRNSIRANHTATHLLHQALRDALGDHVAQAGSYVGPDRLRFDISHPSAMSEEEMLEVETAVNDRVARNRAVVTSVETPDEAKSRGAMALFGEKYGDEVRVVSIDDDDGDARPWSLELCGGTHVARTGDIGPFVILSERAVAAGVRRIEALTQAGAVAAFQEQRRLLKELSAKLKTSPEELGGRIDQLQKQVKEAKKQKKSAAGDQVTAAFQLAKTELEKRGGVVAGALDFPELDRDGIRQLGERLKGAEPDLALVLFGRGEPGSNASGVPFVALCAGEALAKGISAGDLATKVKALLGGGGGGRADSAQGQGERADAIPAAIHEVVQVFQVALR